MNDVIHGLQQYKKVAVLTTHVGHGKINNMATAHDDYCLRISLLFSFESRLKEESSARIVLQLYVELGRIIIR